MMCFSTEAQLLGHHPAYVAEILRYLITMTTTITTTTARTTTSASTTTATTKKQTVSTDELSCPPDTRDGVLGLIFKGGWDIRWKCKEP